MRALTRRELLAAAAVTAAAATLASCAAPTRDTAVSQTAWEELTKRLRGAVLRPGDPEFAAMATPRNLRFAATMPQAVVMCADTDDVAAAVRWARETDIGFAVRGGGHNYADASSSAGLIIATRAMNDARIEGTRLRAQAGVRNSDLATLLAGGSLLLPGGNCPNVGVVGVTLGGGIGPNAPWAGLTADRLRRVTLVVADGGVVTASETDNPGLFWPLRGGAGGNFGIVTELEYDLIEVPVTRATTAELTVTGRDAATAVATGFQRLRAEAGRTLTGNLYLGHADGDVEAVLTAQALTGEAEAREMMADLLGISGLRADIAERSWWDAYGWYVTPPSPNYSFWDRSLFADDFLTPDAVATALEVVSRFPQGEDPERYGAMGLYGWVGGAVSDVAADATAYVHRGAPILVEMSSGWTTPADPALPVTPIPPDIKDWEQELWETLLPHTNGHSYQNFPDPELTDWAASYYGDNLARLSATKTAWDPEGVFTYAQAVPPVR